MPLLYRSSFYSAVDIGRLILFRELSERPDITFDPAPAAITKRHWQPDPYQRIIAEESFRWQSGFTFIEIPTQIPWDEDTDFIGHRISEDGQMSVENPLCEHHYLKAPSLDVGSTMYFDKRDGGFLSIRLGFYHERQELNRFLLSCYNFACSEHPPIGSLIETHIGMRNFFNDLHTNAQRKYDCNWLTTQSDIIYLSPDAPPVTFGAYDGCFDNRGRPKFLDKALQIGMHFVCADGDDPPFYKLQHNALLPGILTVLPKRDYLELPSGPLNEQGNQAYHASYDNLSFFIAQAEQIFGATTQFLPDDETTPVQKISPQKNAKALRPFFTPEGAASFLLMAQQLHDSAAQLMLSHSVSRQHALLAAHTHTPPAVAALLLSKASITARTEPTQEKDDKALTAATEIRLLQRIGDAFSYCSALVQENPALAKTSFGIYMSALREEFKIREILEPSSNSSRLPQPESSLARLNPA